MGIANNYDWKGGGVVGNLVDPLGFGKMVGLGKKKKSGPQEPSFQPYSGYKPPHVGNLRPVEDQITQILMQRSKGEDVGYDPKRREELLENFNIQQGRDLEDQNADIQNRISGMGLSRNPAVYDELMGRATREAGREKNLYTNRVDIEDLDRRSEERDLNTGRLQNLNTFNFGQENQVADFDLSVYGAENSARNAGRGLDLRERQLDYDTKEDAFGTAIASAADIGSILAAPSTGGMSLAANQAFKQTQTPSAGAYSSPSSGYGGASGTDARRNYLNQMALQSGKNFQF